jgi:hypothetical protein
LLYHSKASRVACGNIHEFPVAKVNSKPCFAGPGSGLNMQHRTREPGQCLDRRQALQRSCRALMTASGIAVSYTAFQQLCFAQSDNDKVSDQDGNEPSGTSLPTVSVVRFRDDDGNDASVEGRVLVRAVDGGLLVEDSAGRLWTIPQRRLEVESPTARSFSHFGTRELGDSLLKDARAAGIDAEFHIEMTDNYVIAASTTAAYSAWTGQLLERIQLAFQSYWKNRDFELQPLAASLPVLILSDQTQFAKLAEFDRTPASAQGEGYFLVTANRIVLFDLTARNAEAAATTISEVQRRAQMVPASVATVVHEATHQIAFNRGMHCRYADNPVWLTEGMAMYFEAPDLKSRRSWSTIGKVNAVRLHRFRQFLKTSREANSIETLVRDNSRFAEAELAIDAYSEAWALTYFLIRTRIRDYLRYLKSVSQKQPLQWDTPDERLAEFRSAFGEDLEKLNRELLNFTGRL